jgi:hypothetical protein
MVTTPLIFPVEAFERILQRGARRRALVFVLPLLVVDSEQGLDAERQGSGGRGATMGLRGSSFRRPRSYRTLRTLLSVGVLMRSGRGWRFWSPGTSEPGPDDHVICPLEHEGKSCGPHWVGGYEELNPPTCRRHGKVMWLCKGCRLCRV